MAKRRAIIDRVHDLVYLPTTVARCMDTPYFQRLRGLKQLGVASYVYPGAVHTRFEHSIGVAHLARALIHRIRDAQPDLRLDPADDVVLMLAGLGHDIGHGPFSHLFEDVIARNMGLQFDHEAMSQRLTRRMLDGIVTPAVADDVLAVMNGASAAKRAAFDGPRGVLLDIVSNKRCGVDVDKLDYFLRDSLSCYGRPTVDARYARLFNAARAVPLPDGQWALGFDCKVMLDLRELWTLRSKLHVAVYQHRTVKNVGHMIGDALLLAEPHFEVDGRGARLRDCIGDEDRFMTLGDWILDAVAASANPALRPAQDILRRLKRRDLYRVLASATLAPLAVLNPAAVKEAVLSEVTDVSHRAALSELLIADIIHVTPAKHAGDDPLANIPFVRTRDAAKSADLQPLKIGGGASPPSVFTSANYRDRTVLVFLRPSWNGVAQSEELATVAAGAMASWQRRLCGEGVLEPSCFVPYGEEDLLV
jgi:HD superfamily phosphohydrolase